jgi:pimeloyl-ACP methyl ester carboxylesterase
MKLKKSYAAAAFGAAILLLTGQSGCMSFRKSESEQREILRKKGQPAPVFQTYEAAGRSIHLTKVGNDSLPLVVLVHGSPGSSSEVLDYLGDSLLRQQAQVAGIDRPGFGWSGFGKAERSLKKQAEALVPLLKQSAAHKKILVGHSYGGPVIVRAAIDYPELVDGLVIVAGSIDPALEPRQWWTKPLDWRLIRWMLPPALRVSNQEILPLYQELTDMLPNWEKVKCPVTVIQGLKDKLVPPGNADFAEKQLVNSLKVNILRLPDDGHFLFWTKREIVVKEILEMLRAVKSVD